MVVFKKIVLALLLLWAIVSCNEAPSARADDRSPRIAPSNSHDQPEFGHPEDLMFA